MKTYSESKRTETLRDENGEVLSETIVTTRQSLDHLSHQDICDRIRNGVPNAELSMLKERIHKWAEAEAAKKNQQKKSEADSANLDAKIKIIDMQQEKQKEPEKIKIRKEDKQLQDTTFRSQYTNQDPFSKKTIESNRSTMKPLSSTEDILKHVPITIEKTSLSASIPNSLLENKLYQNTIAENVSPVFKNEVCDLINKKIQLVKSNEVITNFLNAEMAAFREKPVPRNANKLNDYLLVLENLCNPIYSDHVDFLSSEMIMIREEIHKKFYPANGQMPCSPAGTLKPKEVGLDIRKPGR